MLAAARYGKETNLNRMAGALGAHSDDDACSEPDAQAWYQPSTVPARTCTGQDCTARTMSM